MERLLRDLPNNHRKLEPGMAADIVAMARSPLEDIRALMDVGFVMRDGIVFKGPGSSAKPSEWAAK